MLKEKYEEKNAGGLDSVLEEVAKLNGVSVDEVRKEIMKGLMVGRASGEPRVQERWREINTKEEGNMLENVILWSVKSLLANV